MATPGDPAAIKAEVERLRQITSELAEVLYDLDADPAVRILTDTGAFDGATADQITAAVDDFEDLWPGWASLRDVTDHLGSLVDAGQLTQAQALLESQTAVTIPDRPPMPPATAAAWLIETASETQALAAKLADSTMTLTPRLDDARARLGRVEEHSAALGVTDDPDIVAARQALANAGTLALRDPLSCDPSVAEDAVTAAEERIAALTAQRDHLANALTDARRLVNELAVLIPQGRDALHRSREKIAAPAGLLEPMDLAALDGEPLGLRPWLGRIADAAARGEWQSATAGLQRWQRVAEVHIANARRIVQRNSAPTERRDELRGLLEALRAKAGAIGLIEDPEATRLHDEARQLLWVAPCPLDQAEELVEAYRSYLAQPRAEGSQP